MTEELNDIRAELEQQKVVNLAISEALMAISDAITFLTETDTRLSKAVQFLAATSLAQDDQLAHLRKLLGIRLQ